MMKWYYVYHARYGVGIRHSDRSARGLSPVGEQGEEEAFRRAIENIVVDCLTYNGHSANFSELLPRIVERAKREVVPQLVRIYYGAWKQGQQVAISERDITNKVADMLSRSSEFRKR